MDEVIKYELPADTAKRFTHVTGAPPVFNMRQHGDVDIRTLTPEKAQALIDAGCPHIVAAETPAKAEKPKTPAE